MTSPVYNQNGFQFYDDDGAPGSSTGQGINTDASYSSDVGFQLRIEIEVTNSKAVNNASFRLFAQRYNSGDTPQGAAFQITSASTGGMTYYDSTNLTDTNADSSDRLTGAGTSSLTFNTGLVVDATSDWGGIYPTTTGFDFAGTDHNEVHFGLVIDSGVGSDGDYYIIEIRRTDDTQIDGYTRKPRVDRVDATVERRIFITHA